MEHLQFAAVVLMALLGLKVLLLPLRVTANAIVNRARWLSVASIVLIGVQFLLQYMLGLRAMGVTQAVLPNLVFFLPASWLMSLAVLYLQRQGRTTFLDRWIGAFSWILVLLLLSVAAAVDGQPLLSDTPELHQAEVASSGVYLLMQGYYSWRLYTNLRAMRIALSNYYDSDMDGLLRWMRYSIIILSCFALIVPLLIYMPNGGLPLFGLFFFASIFYLVDSFCSYVVSSAPRKVAEAEVCEETMQLCEDRSMSPDGDLTELTPDVVTRINRSVERWTSTGGHLHAGMKMPQTAKELGLPQYQLSAWLRQNGLKYADWMTDLRIDEAKRLLESHHDWSNEAIAAHCGFSDRSYFQRKFKETIGISPTEYLMHVASN